MLFTLAVAASFAHAGAPELPLDAGQRIYLARCATCHGADGDGDGPSARYLDPRPRDFTAGLFKFRSTMPGSAPSDADLAETIAHGLPGTSMPPFAGTLSDAELGAVVDYIQGFSDRFDQGPPAPLEVSARPKLDAEAASRGAALFTATCLTCHGPEGEGDGPGGEGLLDGWGEPISPANLTRGVYKSGAETPEDLFVIISTGIEGTPMPPWFGLPAEQRWDLVAYVMSLTEGGGWLGAEAGRVPERAPQLWSLDD